MRPVGVLAGHIRGPARHFGRLLRVEPEIDHRRQHLQIDLHLVVGAGRAEDAPQRAVLQHQWRVHRVTHPAPGPQPVRMAGLEVPIGHAVVEQDAGVAGDDAGTKAAVDALHAGDGVAVAIGGAEIGRVAGGSGAMAPVGAARRMSMPAGEPRGVVGGQQLARAALRRERGSAPQRSRSAKASFFASTMTCTASADSRPIAGEIEMLEDLQLLEQYEAGRVGRRLEHGEAAIVDRDRLLLLGLERFEIGGRDQTSRPPRRPAASRRAKRPR